MIEVSVVDHDNGTLLARWEATGSFPRQGERIHLSDGTVRRVIHAPLWFPADSAVVLTVGPA